MPAASGNKNVARHWYGCGSNDRRAALQDALRDRHKAALYHQCGLALGCRDEGCCCRVIHRKSTSCGIDFLWVQSTFKKALARSNSGNSLSSAANAWE